MPVPISNVTRRVVFAASGTGPYAFTFEILAATDIAVYRDDTLLTLTTDYTVTINSNGTGSITLTAAPTGATQIAIVGNRTIARTTDFVTGGDFFANTLNDELDQQTIFAQQNAEGLQRALQAPQTDPTSINMTLPGRTARANKTLSFDANGNPTPGVSAADVANAVTYATNAANSATAAAASASAASSSASSASSSASTATTQASNASSSASAASTSASNASTSATNAANSASSASTSASNASTSATNAANSASTATTQASNAATSATNAANSATAAATSETNAANSATAAASSATAAAASASAAANTFDSFDDRYLGTKASNPTVDNDGNALVAGALYFSTTENIMKVYDGASWIAATSAGNVSFLRFRYVATSGQTTFSGADSNAATLTYTVNNIVVFLNGVSLDQTEYTATSGTSVVLGTGAALNDELVIVAFKSFVTADMVPASTGGTFAGNVTVTGTLTATGSGSIQGLTVGRGAGAVSTNTAVGASALAANTTGSGNHAFGNGALASNTGANNQSAFGYQALYSSNRTSDNNAGNSAFGYQAAYATTTGQYNSAFGWSALVGNTTGNDNVAVGKWSLKSNTSGSNNVAVGLDSLQANTTASDNTALGYQAAYSTTTGYEGVYLGARAGFTQTTARGNVLIGRDAGYSTTGGFNTFVGFISGNAVTTGTKNTIVGAYSGNQNSLDIRTLSNNIVLSDGDGNAKGVYDDKGGSTFVSTTIGSVVGGGAAANLCSTGSIWRTNNTLQSAIVLVTASGSNNVDSGWSGAWILHCYKSFGTYAVTVMSSNLYLGSAGYSFTFSLDASNLKVSAGKTTGFTYVVERLGANGTA